MVTEPLIRKAIVEKGVVINVIKCARDFKIKGKTLIETGEQRCGPGFLYKSGTFEPPEEIVEYDYITERKAAYPAIEDQLDAIMKFADQADAALVGPELKAMAKRCMDVKKKFPKKLT